MNKIDFEVTTQYGVFRDALYLRDEEIQSLSEQDIENLKQQRVDNWISAITAPPVETIKEVIEAVSE